jgi:hypothetical protein
MAKWFKTVIKFEKTADDGNIVKVSESYLVDALSFTEAEARIIEEVKPFISGEFEIDKVSKMRINELFYNDEGDKWFRAKVSFITLDEEKGVEKRTSVFMMCQANDMEQAVAGIIKGMSGTMEDYEIFSVTQSDIVDVFKYEAEQL